MKAPADNRRSVLKKQYLASVPSSTSEQDQARLHLDYLVEYTRRLNMVECKSGNQPMIKPSMVRRSDLFICVELCAESIQENAFLQTIAEFRPCWIAFMELLERVKSKDGSDKLFETSFLLFHLAASIFKRYIMDGTIEKEPNFLSIEGYSTLAAEFTHPLFKSIKSPSDQLKNLTENLKSLKVKE